MANIQVPTNLLLKEMKPGQMSSIRIYNSRLKRLQTSFVIKDFAKNIDDILNTNIANDRGYVEVYGNAASLIYLIGFGEDNKYLYNYWFNYHSKSINSHELEDLSHQDAVEYLLVDHKNNMINVIKVPNSLVEAAPQYIKIAKQRHWTPSEFEELQANVMKDFKTYRGIWDYVTENMSA